MWESSLIHPIPIECHPPICFTYSKNANREYMKVGFFNSGMTYFRKNVHVLYGIFKYLYGGFRSHGGYPQSSILDWDFP